MKKRNSKIDKLLLATIIIFSIFGLIMVLSASSMESYMRYDKSPYNYFFRHLIFVLLGLVAYFILHLVPTKVYKKTGNLLIVGTFLSMIGLIIYGQSTRETVSWFQIGPISIQPSEFAKIFVVLFLGSYYNKHKNNLDTQWVIIKPLIISFLLCVLVALQPDLGTASIIAIITLLIFYVVPIKKEIRKTFNKIFVGGIAIVLVLFITTKGTILRDYQFKRLYSFIYNPCERYQDEEGYQLCNSYIAFHNGSVTGKGIGDSTQKYLYLPDSYTDFIFPIVVEEWGMIVGILVVVGYGFILYRIFKIARNTKNLANGIFAYGVFAYFLLHVSVNLIGVMGLGPLTGVPLPFLSYGGSYTLSLFIALGIVQRISIENYREQKKGK